MKKILFGLIAIVFGFVSGFTIVGAYNVKFSGGFTPIPAYVYASSSFSSQTINAIHNACVTWNNAGVGNLVYRSTTLHNTTPFPYLNNRNEITKGTRGLGEYLMRMEEVQIVNPYTNVALAEGDIDINVSYDFGTAATSYDTQSIITHEIGHLLGLAECTSHPTCVMYQNFTINDVRRVLQADDIAGIREIYE